MDGWNQGWNDPREFEQQSYYGEAYQQWEPYTKTHMPFNHTCALCGSPQHSPFECDLRFEYPEFMQEYEYTISMHQDPMTPQAFPQGVMSLQVLNFLKSLPSGKLVMQEEMRPLPFFKLPMQEWRKRLINSYFTLPWRNNPSLCKSHNRSLIKWKPPLKKCVLSIMSKSSIFIQEDDVDMQEEPLDYGGREVSKEEMEASIDGFVQVWKANGLVIEDTLEEEDEHVEEEDATLEAMHHVPSANEAETPQVDENPFMPCHEEVIEESRISLPLPSKEQHHEFPKEQVRTLSTHVHNETIEIKVLLPLNPPFSAQCFYDEVKDWKGSCTLVDNSPPHSHIPLPHTHSTSIKSTSSLKEEPTRIIAKSFAKKRNVRRKPLLRSSIGELMDCFCFCLYDTSRSPLAPNSTVVLHKKYPP